MWACGMQCSPGAVGCSGHERGSSESGSPSSSSTGRCTILAACRYEELHPANLAREGRLLLTARIGLRLPDRQPQLKDVPDGPLGDVAFSLHHLRLYEHSWIRPSNLRQIYVCQSSQPLFRMWSRTVITVPG